MRFSALAASVLVASAACQKPKPPPGEPQPAQAAVAPAPTPKPKPALEPLPADPGPIVPDSPVDEAALSAALSSAVYVSAWEPAKRHVLRAMLTRVSELIGNQPATGTNVDTSKRVDDEAKAQKVEDPARQVWLYFARKAKLPPDFEKRFREHLAATKAEPNLGTWTPPQEGKPLHDYSALAFIVNREDPMYIRAYIAARGRGPTAGPFEWHKKPLLRNYLETEIIALTWLHMVLAHQTPPGQFTPSEAARFQHLGASKFLNVAVEQAEIADVLGTYAKNEVKGDATFQGRAIVVTGIVREVKKDFTNRIYVELGKGSELFEHPTLHCFVDSRFAAQVGEFEKGGKLTVKAKVKGLVALSVVADPCEPAD